MKDIKRINMKRIWLRTISVVSLFAEARGRNPPASDRDEIVTSVFCVCMPSNEFPSSWNFISHFSVSFIDRRTSRWAESWTLINDLSQSTKTSWPLSSSIKQARHFAGSLVTHLCNIYQLACIVASILNYFQNGIFYHYFIMMWMALIRFEQENFTGFFSTGKDRLQQSQEIDMCPLHISF